MIMIIKTKKLSFVQFSNELMMKGDRGEKHFKFHADKNATSPVSYNQCDYEG